MATTTTATPHPGATLTPVEASLIGDDRLLCETGVEGGDLLAVGRPAHGCRMPAIGKKPLADVAAFLEQASIVIDRVTLLLALQRAFLGAVPAELRAVTCGCEGEHVVLRFLFDGAIDSGDEDDPRIVGTEVISNFASPATIEEQFVRLDYPADLNAHGLKEWAYQRKEGTAGGRPFPRCRLLKGG